MSDHANTSDITSAENADIVSLSSPDSNQSYAQYEAQNITPEAPSDTQEVKRIKIRKMLRAGFKPGEISKVMEVAQSYVYKIRKEVAVEEPNGPSAEAIAQVHHFDGDEKRQEMLLALFDSRGIAAEACKKVGIHYTTHLNWLKKDPDYAERVAEIQEVAIDFVEGELFKQIERGVPVSTTFYLRTKGKHRGYTERMEHTGADGGPVAVRVIEPYVDPLADVEGEVVEEAILDADEVNEPS